MDIFVVRYMCIVVCERVYVCLTGVCMVVQVVKALAYTARCFLGGRVGKVSF